MGEREQMTSTLMVWVESAEAQDRMESAGKRPMRAAAKRCICGFTKKHTPGGSERVTRADSFKRLLGDAGSDSQSLNGLAPRRVRIHSRRDRRIRQTHPCRTQYSYEA